MAKKLRAIRYRLTLDVIVPHEFLRDYGSPQGWDFASLTGMDSFGDISPVIGITNVEKVQDTEINIP